MKKVRLGSTGLEVCPLVFGTLPLGPLQAGLSPREGGRLILHALERGVDLLDTAELYGTYPHIREALRDWGGRVHIATKTHAPDAATARAHVEKALRELGVERLDIVHLHGARLSDPFSERAEVLAELSAMKKEGKIAHLGLSSHYISAMRLAAESSEIAVVHPLINRTGMGILDGTAEEMAAAIAEVSSSGKGVYAMKALAGGNLISEALESLSYVRDLGGIDGVAVGMLSEEEIEANLSIFAEGPRESVDWEALQGRRRQLAVMDNFCKGCGACVAACTNDALCVTGGKVLVDDERCLLCGYCAAACPEFIIRVV